MPLVMGDYEVSRWRRYGKDRLYVKTPDGAQVGWVCLQTGEKVVDLLEHWPGFDEAVTAWRRDHDGADPIPTPRPAPTSTPAAGATHPGGPADVPGSAVSPARDLATNRAGAAVREQAVAARRQAPVKTLLARVMGVHTDERAWRIGADGEQAVAAQLARLGPRWRELHSIPVGEQGADIDHLVIGPGGVFTLNTKHHPGAGVWLAGNNMRVNGRPEPYIRKARFEADRAARLLTGAAARPVEVTGIVVFYRAAKLVVREHPTDVTVCECQHVRRHLAAQPEILSDHAVETIYTAARRSDTWTTKP